MSPVHSITATDALYVLIPGFGQPHRFHKIALLKNNLEVLAQLAITRRFKCIYLTICLYDIGEELAKAQIQVQSVLEDAGDWVPPGFFQFHVVAQPGIVGQFMLRHPTPIASNVPESTVPILKTTYTFLLLDDVELKKDVWTPDAWYCLFYDYERHRIDIASPVLTHDSKFLFPYMLQRTFPGNIDVISITSACEFFCYLMRTEVWNRYLAEIREDHPWLWGIDLVLSKHLKFRVGMFHGLTMRHHYQSDHSNASAASQHTFQQMRTYLAHYGETQESLATLPAILEDICIYHRELPSPGNP